MAARAPVAAWFRALGAAVETTNLPPWPPLSVPQIRPLVPELLYF
jgi:hypothetical protein